jgi:hypothetical protein
MKSLREARGVTETAVKRLAKLQSPPRHLHTVELELADNRPHTLDDPALAPVLALPSLRALRVHFGFLDTVAPGSVRQFCEALVERLERLVLTGNGTILGNGAVFEPLLDGGRTGKLQVLGWGTVSNIYATALRDEQGRWSTLELRCEPLDLLVNEGGYFRELARVLVERFPAGRFEVGRVNGCNGARPDAVEAAEQLLARVAKKVERVSAVTA